MVNLLTFDPDTCNETDAEDAQQQLAAAGYYHDKIDGEFWTDSRAALDHWRMAQPETHLSPLQLAVLDQAAQYNGLSEIVDNTKWAFVTRPNDRTIPDQFKAALEDVGWQAPWAYCIAAAKAVWKQAFAKVGRDFSFYEARLDVSCLNSWDKCKEANLVTKTPSVGAIMILQHGGTSLGHSGIVRGVQGDTLLTWEANTSATSSDPNRDREGDVVTYKTRPFDFTVTDGLHLLGFVPLPA